MSVELRGMVESARRRARWVLWRLRHPLSPFSEYYVYRVNRQLDRGKAHPTLGDAHSDPEWFAESARAQLGFLQAHGLRSDQRVVDYGCGSLRLGRSLIAFLDPGCYWGVDVTDRYFRIAERELPSGLIQSRRARLDVLADAGPQQLSAFEPDWIVSTAVLMHVPPTELAGFVAGLLEACAPHTRCFVTYKETDSDVQLTPMTWGYTGRRIVEVAEAQGAVAEVLRDVENEELLGYRDGRYRVLSLRRAAPAP